MQTKKIRKRIKEAVVIEKKTGNLTDAIYGLAVLRGVQLSSKDLDEVHKFVQEYIEHAPAIMDQIASEAKRTGIFDEVFPILEAAEQYFFTPMDIIPDNLGLLGLVEDAYLTHSLIQAWSNSHYQQTGKPLIPMDLTLANQIIHGMIGEPQASILDVAVETLVNGPNNQQSFNFFQSLGHKFNITGPDPIWGNATMDEIVNARLGAMGVV
jgi:uncharacterized membrane protein YkvA (DUF1232 family)